MPGKKRTEIRVRIYSEAEPFLGIGRIQLLENIVRHGSIARGAAAMQMSYRKAWKLVQHMNELSTEPLVEKKLGGSKGGGALVTKAGMEMIRKFYLLQQSAEKFVEEKARELGL